MRFVALLVSVLILAACAPADGSGAPGDTTVVSTPIPTDEQSCRVAGGNWRRVCLMGTWSCVVKYADAGKTCRDGDECQGKQCRYNGKPVTDSTTEVTGSCVATSDPCGCFTLVQDGKADAALCVD